MLLVAGKPHPGRVPSHPAHPLDGGDQLSVQAISWVIENSQHKESRFVVLLMIANHARSDGTGAWPSIPTLARESRISDRTCQRVIQRLERSGELSIQRGKGPHGTNLYSLAKMSGVNLSPVVPIGSLGGDRRCHQDGDTIVSPEPSLNRPSEKEKVEIRQKRDRADRQTWLRRYKLG